MSFLSPQFATYATVGAVGTAAHYGVLIGLTELAGVPPYLGAVAGYGVGAVVNYALNYRITFRSSARHSVAFTRFVTVAAAGALLTGGLMAWATERMGIHYLAAQVATTVAMLFLTYTGNRLWSFR